MKQEIISRLEALRNAMRASHIDAVIIPKTDPHQSEYLADHWQIIRWLSGFTGSAATMVVTADKALLWTDSRYFIQAAAQLDGSTVEMMKEGIEGTPTIDQYLLDTLPEGAWVGIDGLVFPIERTNDLIKTLGSKHIMMEVNFTPFDEIWAGRPALPADPVFIHDIKYAGESAADKIGRVLKEVEMQGAREVFISDLAEIAWTLNIRSNDVPENPVVMSFLYLSPDGSTLFIDPAKLTDEVKDHLKECNVVTRPYGDVRAFLGELPASARVLLSSTQSAGAFLSILGDRAVLGESPVAILKAVKNPVQIEGIRNAMEKDGVALVRSFMEIEKRLAEGVRTTELDVADILRRHRSEQDLFFDISFETICGYGPHGAIVHYSATPETDVPLQPDGLLLVDSGANFLDGTTDITRTVSLGNPTAEQRRDFTLVMQGHIALATAVYPVGTRGAQLDAFARMPLWKAGMTYLHGTGHGVGHFLNVHEGPQTIRLNNTPAPLLPGMITSDEPGVYREGCWGVRCENLVLTTEAMTTEFGSFLRFETLTLYPFDTTLMDTSMMSPQEIAWVNDYHTEVYRRLSPRLTADEAAWLKDKCKKI